MSKGISKGISKENIVHVTLELIKDMENIRNVNLRAIAKVLGCAHTNIYNHFADLDEILWEVMDEVLIRFADYLFAEINAIEDDEIKHHYFFKCFIEFYIENAGWYRLFWMEKLHGRRPEKNIILTAHTVERYITVLDEIYRNIYGEKLSHEQLFYVFHAVHCYLHGEVSIYISGRGLISDESTFKKKLIQECVKISKLLVRSIKAEE